MGVHGIPDHFDPATEAALDAALQGEEFVPPPEPAKGSGEEKVEDDTAEDESADGKSTRPNQNNVSSDLADNEEVEESQDDTQDEGDKKADEKDGEKPTAKTKAKKAEEPDPAADERAMSAARKALEFARRRDEHKAKVAAKDDKDGAAPAVLSQDALREITSLRDDPTTGNLAKMRKLLKLSGWEDGDIDDVVARSLDEYASQKLGLDVDSKTQGQDSEAARLRKKLADEQKARRQAEELRQRERAEFEEVRAQEAAQRAIERQLKDASDEFKHLLAWDEGDPAELVYHSIKDAYDANEINDGFDPMEVIKTHAKQANDYLRSRLEKQAKRLGLRLEDVNQEQETGQENAKAKSNKPRAGRTLTNKEASETPDAARAKMTDQEAQLEDTWQVYQKELAKAEG